MGQWAEREATWLPYLLRSVGAIGCGSSLHGWQQPHIRWSTKMGPYTYGTCKPRVLYIWVYYISVTNIQRTPKSITYLIALHVHTQGHTLLQNLARIILTIYFKLNAYKTWVYLHTQHGLSNADQRQTTTANTSKPDNDTISIGTLDTCQGYWARRTSQRPWTRPTKPTVRSPSLNHVLICNNPHHCHGKQSWR